MPHDPDCFWCSCSWLLILADLFPSRAVFQQCLDRIPKHHPTGYSQALAGHGLGGKTQAWHTAQLSRSPARIMSMTTNLVSTWNALVPKQVDFMYE